MALLSGVEQALGRAFDNSEIIGVAVSGGPDSMALLALAQRCWPGRVAAATVDHCLRPASADEAVMVSAFCGLHGIAHATLRPDTPISGSVQAAARAARYALLERWRMDHGVDWLLTAHHADDQCETMIMRLNRASGVAGLAGVRTRQGRVVRPLLGTRRAALRAFAQTHDLPFVDDPSNADMRFDRARVRQAMDGDGVLDPLAVARSAANLAAAEEALAWVAGCLFAERAVVGDDGGLCLSVGDLPQDLRRRLLIMAIERMNGGTASPRADTICEAIVQLSHGKQVSIGNCIVSGTEQWLVCRAPPRRTGT